MKISTTFFDNFENFINKTNRLLHMQITGRRIMCLPVPVKILHKNLIDSIGAPSISSTTRQFGC